ncbi:phage antirepressor [Clostridium sp. Ade.TY]|uniref:phage antirepressor n=1 Tax=Clostridium sp. Ade.TY TaxID=1391647 RepID=UPI000415EFA7|nr:phage antirepressor [Clostridium sp. Ade.TY]
MEQVLRKGTDLVRKQIQIFNNAEFGQVRVLNKDGEPWFVGKDVAERLGYKNINDAIRKHIDEEDKGVAKCDTLGGKQELTIINESGLYSLIISSKLPNTKKFKRWVTSEILPSIRKNGMYATDELLDNPDLLIAAATKLKEEREKNRILNEINEKQTQIIGELKPRADYTDKILKNTGLVTITQIAKDYGMSGQALNKMLHELKVQYKQSDQWLLYRNHQGKGYTASETQEIIRSDGRLDIKMNTKWTQKGRLFIYELLKSEGVLPTIEKYD